ncbi:RHS repeat domain-containing protein [Actinorhabdospora filicis]|nr:RHS repeat-associated core domain-containing protein [Actinorhabdospora filicis]
MTRKALFRSLTGAMALVLTTGLLLGRSSLPEPAVGLAPDPASAPPVEGVDVDPALADHDINQVIAGMQTSMLPHPLWPEGSSVNLALKANTPVAANDTAAVSIAPTGDGNVGSVRLDVLGREETKARGRSDGLLFQLTRTDSGREGTVSARVDYSRFAHAYGADWRDRLSLWTVPDCAGCAPERLRTDNDLATTSATAEIALSGTTTTTVLLAADQKGSSGDFTASKLSPSSTWTQGGNSGSFNWSYPMAVPSPNGVGPTPNLAINYSSASVDGRSEATNNQPGWIGEGFSLEPASIERRYVSCSEDRDGGANNPTKTGDRCWRLDNAMLSMAGHAGELIPAGAGKWRLKNDDGTVVERRTDTDNTDDDNEYWRVTTSDGIQYYFGLNRLPGWTSGKPTTNSVWTVPVAGNNSGEPCHATSFTNSFCDQAWKWNLDYVVDLSGNSMSYWYETASNNYGKESDASKPVSYTRSGELARIDYGTDNRDGTEYDGKVPARVDFTLEDRCLTGCATKDEAHWPDTPWDLSCDSTTSCPDSRTPTFWSSKRLTKVTTSVWDIGLGKHMPVDSWSLTHTFPNPGDGTRAGLWLKSIVHTGHVGADSPTPSIDFDWVQKYNRVDVGDGEPTMNWMRLAAIWTETGGLISMTYTPVDCVSPSAMPTSPGDNSKRCYPVLSQDPYDEGKLNTRWYHKYLVSSVSQYDQLEGLNTVTTSYEYAGSPAWRFAERDALVDDKYRTWSDFRGYETVRTRVGLEGDQSLTETKYFRGMQGDKLPGGGTRNASVTGSVGPAITDDNLYSGIVRETTTYNGVSDKPVTRLVYEPWKSAPTATRTIDGNTTTANFVRYDAVTYAQTALDQGRGWRSAKIEKKYEDIYGSVDYVDDQGDINATGDEKCTWFEYNRNTAINLLNPAKRVYSYATTCSAPVVSGDDGIVSDIRTSFDGLDYDATPTRGLATKSEMIKSFVPTGGGTGISNYVVVAQTKFDVLGRPIESQDVRGKWSKTAYTPATGGPVTSITNTNPLGWTTTTTKNARGDALLTIDANNKKTELAYDGLGRLTKVWTTARTKAQNPNSPMKEFSYTLSKDGKNVVVSKTLDAAAGPGNPHYTSTYALYDGLLRDRQTQTPSPDGGRIITDTLYDNHGRAYAAQGPFRSTGLPSGTLYQTVAGEVDARSITQFDRADRPTAQIAYRKLTELWRTVTRYAGDSTTVIPPVGGVPLTTVTNIDGKPIEQRQHLTPDATGATLSLYYTYNDKDQLTDVTDADGRKWKFGFDLLGRQTTSTDPDSGTITSEYGDGGDLLATVDARGERLAYSYDDLGRKTGLYDDTVSPANRRLEWRFDTLVTGASLKGQAAGWSRFTPDGEYRFDIQQMNAGYQVVNSLYTIPAVEGALAGTYTYTQNYTLSGAPLTTGIPMAGNLDGEGLTIGYDATTGLPKTYTGSGAVLSGSYVTDTVYSPIGQLKSVTASRDGLHVKRANTYDPATGRLTHVGVSRETAPTGVSETEYAYNPAGNITGISESIRGDNQCFAYDSLQRLTEAWTPANGECSTPASAALGGPAPYWKSYEQDLAGNRTKLTDHTATGGTRTTTYTQTDATHPHAVTGASTTTGTGTTLSQSFTYDLAGNTKTRVTPAGTPQTLSWDSEQRLTTITGASGDATQIYGADGARLIRRDAKGATLYLPGQEVRYDKAANNTTCTRYYTYAGSTLGIRTTTGGLVWVFNDHQGTASTTIDNSNQQNVTTRYQDPYGNPRGAPKTSWPGERGFQNGVNDPSGLTHIGAREYDSVLGRFISDDPVNDTSSSQQLHGYAYANNSPILMSDPSGLVVQGESDGSPFANNNPYASDEDERNGTKNPGLAQELRDKRYEQIINGEFDDISDSMDEMLLEMIGPRCLAGGGDEQQALSCLVRALFADYQVKSNLRAVLDRIDESRMAKGDEFGFDKKEEFLAAFWLAAEGKSVVSKNRQVNVVGADDGWAFDAWVDGERTEFKYLTSNSRNRVNADFRDANRQHAVNVVFLVDEVSTTALEKGRAMFVRNRGGRESELQKFRVLGYDPEGDFWEVETQSIYEEMRTK